MKTKGKVTIEIEIEYEWIKPTGDGIHDPIDGGYYDFEVPTEKELSEIIEKAIEEDALFDV